MTPEEVKQRFDGLAADLWKSRQELEDLATLLQEDFDISAAKSILTDLSWAVENCSVIGLHQIGEAMDDKMGY